MKKIFIIAFVCTFIDQVVKILLSGILEVGQSINIVSSFFAVTMLHNTGAAFSILTS